MLISLTVIVICFYGVIYFLSLSVIFIQCGIIYKCQWVLFTVYISSYHPAGVPEAVLQAKDSTGGREGKQEGLH